MKKTIKTDDFKKIVKMFNLSEAEQIKLETLTREINMERKEYSFDTMFNFRMSPAYFEMDTSEYHAIASILMYFGLKVQKEVGPYFDETCTQLGVILNATAQWIARMFRGMSSNLRWKDKMYLADRFGLNSLELRK